MILRSDLLCAALRALAILFLPAVAMASGSPSGSFVTFESGQVRPLALSPDGSRLFAVNTPDDRLEIFSVTASGLTHTGSVPVGLEPVAVAARTNTEVWVVNHLSDSVSIVDVGDARRTSCARCSSATSRATSSSPGPAATRAFITTARRGQNCPARCRRSSPRPARRARWSAGLRRDQSRQRRSAARRSPIVELFGDTPRALAAARTATPCTPRSSSPATRRPPSRGRRVRRWRTAAAP